jgi:hypothetical protein
MLGRKGKCLGVHPAQTLACGKPSAQTGTSTTQHSVSGPRSEIRRVSVDRPQALFGSFLRIASVRAAWAVASQIAVRQEICLAEQKLSVGEIGDISPGGLVADAMAIKLVDNNATPRGVAIAERCSQLEGSRQLIALEVSRILRSGIRVSRISILTQIS